MAHHPDSDVTTSYVIEEVIWEAIKVASPQTACVKMEKIRSLAHVPDPQLEFRKKIIPEPIGDLVIFRQDLIQVRLDSAVESNLHDS